MEIKMIEILLIEDDPALGRGLSVNLEHEGYLVCLKTNLQSALMVQRKSNFQLIILDLGLPDGSGFSFLKEIRDAGYITPVIILTAKTDIDSVVQGLQSGANDYIRKPFDDRELFARIKTVINGPLTQSSAIRYGGLIVVTEKRKVFFEEKEILLSPREFDILKYFIEHAELVVTRTALLENLDKDATLFDRTIDSNISHIRNRLKKASVQNIQISPIYGVGYRLERI
jgi:DNA-binding response OmpR family regulator